MIPIKYKLNVDLVARAAVTLNWNLKTIKSSINLINIDNSNRMVNAKSLVGLLSGQFREGDQVEILVENKEDLMKVKSYFNEVGREIN